MLNIQNLSIYLKSQGDKNRLVDDISFSIPSSKTIALVGESGSGKSLTALSIIKLLPGEISANGVIEFEGTTILNSSEKEMRKLRGKDIAMIFQEPMTSLNPVYTCGNQIVEAILEHQSVSKKEAEAETLQWLSEVKIAEPERIFHSYPHQLSGGQKQRVMIAIAICNKPKLLIADEPTTALDVTVQARILLVLKEVQEKYGMSVLFISHDLSLVADIADEVVVMQKGKIAEAGTKDEIFKSPKQDYTRALIACRPPLRERLTHLPVINDFINQDKYVDVISFQNKFATTSDSENERRKNLYSQSPVFQVKNLYVSFSQKEKFSLKKGARFNAVDNISFDVFPKETIGLVGESGCGKTTLARAILQLIKPSAGNVIFERKDLTGLRSNEMRRIRERMQLIFQDPYASLNPYITIGEAIAEPLRVHRKMNSERERKDFVKGLLGKVGLDKTQYNQYPHEFSGGQRQRIVIARALALKPSFLICDEIVSALDVSVQAQIINLLYELRDEFGFSAIFISHDFAVVRQVSDRIFVMQSGQIVESGLPEEIIKQPKEKYTQQLINAIPKGIESLILN